METMRLQKYLSRAGVASRRASEQMMLDGRVTVNGQICLELGTKVIPGEDKIEVDGKIIDLPVSYVYVAVNKPQGYITTLDDPEGRPVISDLLPDSMPRIWPVGRLDWDSEGLILMTNDGELTNMLTHPSHEIVKIYAVKVSGIVEPSHKALAMMAEGVDIGEGEVTKPATVNVGRSTGKNTWLEFQISEGRNRQIRRMCEAVGFRVMRLRRLTIGPLELSGTSSGQYRALTTEEVFDLYKACGSEPPSEAMPSKRQKKRTKKALHTGNSGNKKKRKK